MKLTARQALAAFVGRGLPDDQLPTRSARQVFFARPDGAYAIEGVICPSTRIKGQVLWLALFLHRTFDDVSPSQHYVLQHQDHPRRRPRRDRCRC